MEDRIYAAGHGDAFSAACAAFSNSSWSRNAQNKFYDELVSFGATEEEADEFISLMMEG